MSSKPKPRHVRARRAKRAKSCGKRRFRDHAEAVRELGRIRTQSIRPTIPARAYACSYCNGWHLTSQA